MIDFCREVAAKLESEGRNDDGICINAKRACGSVQCCVRRIYDKTCLQSLKYVGQALANKVHHSLWAQFPPDPPSDEEQSAWAQASQSGSKVCYARSSSLPPVCTYKEDPAIFHAVAVAGLLSQNLQHCANSRPRGKLSACGARHVMSELIPEIAHLTSQSRISHLTMQAVRRQKDLPRPKLATPRRTCQQCLRHLHLQLSPNSRLRHNQSSSQSRTSHAREQRRTRCSSACSRSRPQGGLC